MNLQNLIRSAGLIDDVLVRPFNRFSQTVANKRGKTFIPNFSGRNAVQNQVGSGTPIIRPPANVNSPAYTQGGAQRFAAEYGTGAPNVPAAVTSVTKPGWQGNVLGAATTAVGLLGDPFGISEALLGTVGQPNQSRMSLLGGVNTDPLIPKTTPIQRPPKPNGNDLRDYGPRYKEKELAAGAAAERFRPGAGFPGQQSAADRDYESQKRRAEQLAQQDELSKKYRVADLTKAYNTAATPEEKEKIGLEIWATTNPQLAQKLKPGQLGYEQVQSVQAAQSPLGGALQAARNIELADKTSFNAVPSAGFGVGFGANLNTQIPGVQVPANLQENIAGAFTSPVNVPSFDQTAKLFDPAKISEVDRATLIRLFNEGLQKK